MASLQGTSFVIAWFIICMFATRWSAWSIALNYLLCYIIQMIHFKLFDSGQYSFIIWSPIKTCFLALVSNCSFVISCRRKLPQYQVLRSFHRAATLTLVWQVFKFCSFTNSRKIGSDMSTKEEVKPNFRTPPRWGQLIADWHARMTYDM
jgi:heme exporter protein D